MCSAAGWSQDFPEHQNAERKTSWSTAVPAVASEPLTGSQAAVFDRRGPLGTVVVAALADARRTVDLSAVSYSDDGRRRSR